MKYSVIKLDGTYRTAQWIVQDYFDENISESDPVHRNITLLLGEVMRALPSEHKRLPWPDLLNPLALFLLECQKRNPAVLEEATARNAFVEEGRVISLTLMFFPSGQATADVRTSRDASPDDTASIVPVASNETADSGPRPRGLFRSLTGSLFRGHKDHK
ncbi:hypothetical protein BDV12DRAFT_201171 [Aspergillus spectabilis]